MKNNKGLKTGEEIMGSLGQGFETKEDGWYGKEMQAQSDPLIDPGTGAVLTIRVFEFQRNPEWKGSLPAKQDLFNMHWKQIRNMLWGDGLVAVQEEEFAPKVEFKKDKYLIFLVCQPRFGTHFAHERGVRGIHEYLNKKS